MDFGTSPTDILNCNASLSSQQSQIAQCLERLESPAGSVSSEVSAPCSQNGGIQVSAIPTWLSNGMLGTSTSDTQSTGGALPPVSELRPGIRARGGLQLWTLSAQMAYSQSVPDSAHASALAEKHDLDSYSSPNAAYIDTTGTKTQSVGQHSQHHGYQTAAAFSYSDIQRPDLSHAESLASLESAVEQMPQTDPVLDVDSIESAYQQYLCIPLLNIPNAGVSVEQQHSLNGVANDSLFCASKSAHSIPSSLQVQTAPEQKQSSNPSNVASLLSPGDSRMSVQSTVPIQSPVSVLQKTLGFEKAVSTSGDLPSITSKPLSTAATTASNISQPVAAQVQIGGRQKQDTTKICVSKKVHSEQPVSKPAKKAFSAASLVEEVLCYRCKVCKFLHESRAELLKHAEFHHRGSAACVQRRSSFQQGPQPTANRAEKRFLCGKCRRGFFTLDECCRHLSQAHQAKSKKIRLEWIYTNQPDRMRASTPADEVADPHPQQEGTPAQQPPTPAKFGALCAAPARPKQQQQPKCPTPKRKKTGDNVVSSSQMACRRKVSQEQGSFM
ncbi:hypothetical protein HPB48_005119 [Haemaphysalis longicornis]|uniref:C2H2-type domain-containing protein n=1 Tax=Haemaphysalis longicornis TaxID=44386 RepID=A0A9J6FH11_HAELO|nr:hypothetical protein HPB48_005119 [Haemaphysalis longicornis]